jgi:hypothetical protein
VKVNIYLSSKKIFTIKWFNGSSKKSGSTSICASFPCDKVKVITDGCPGARENLMEIKETGLEKWCKKQQEMVDKGLRYSTILAKQKAGGK